MDEQTISRYLELKDILKQNALEMKPLRKELKELEQEIIDSGKTEISHYGVKIVISDKDKEKMEKDNVEIALKECVNKGSWVYDDFYTVEHKKKIKVTDINFDNNKRKKAD